MFLRSPVPLFLLAAIFAPLMPLVVLAQEASPGQSAPASPAPDPVPTRSLVVGAVVSPFSAQTGDTSRTDFSNALITASRPSGVFRYTVYAGEYAFPTVGQALYGTLQRGANTNLFSALPVAYVQFVPNASWTIGAGKLPTLLGQENDFTFQNVNVQRGLGWAIEPTISRGIRTTYASGKFSANLEYNDGYYSGSHRAVEGSAGWQIDPSMSATLVFILPQSDTPGNPTAGIANKAEYDLMITKQYGKLQLLPYVLLIYSPASSRNGFVSGERALAASLIANYAFSDRFSLAARAESAENYSRSADTSPNADLVGYGPGSFATTFTLTPQYKHGHLFARAEYSLVSLGAFAPGLGFGANGNDGAQSRTIFEIGVQY